jgi:hypothetical protein
MAESDFGIPSHETQDDKIFWDNFFNHFEKLKAIGVPMDDSVVLGIATKRDVKEAQKYLFNVVLDQVPTQDQREDFIAAMHFVVESGYTQRTDDSDPSAET